MKRKGLFLLLRILISLFFVSLLLWLMRDSFSSTVLALKGADIPLFYIGLLLSWGSLAIVSFRLKKILGAQQIGITFREAVKLTLVGYFFNNFLPSAVGGDVVKAYYASRKTERKLASVMSIFVDRLIGFLGLIAMAVVALIFWGRYIQNTRIILTVMIIIGILAGLILLLILASRMRNLGLLRSFLRFSRLETLVGKFIEVIKVYSRHRVLMQSMFCLSVLSQFLGAVVVYLLAKSLSLEISLGPFFLLVPIIGVASMFPSLNGLGIREGAYVYYLGPLVGGENAFALSILGLTLLLVNSIIGGVIYTFCRDFRLVHLKEIGE